MIFGVSVFLVLKSIFPSVDWSDLPRHGSATGAHRHCQRCAGAFYYPAPWHCGAYYYPVGAEYHSGEKLLSRQAQIPLTLVSCPAFSAAVYYMRSLGAPAFGWSLRASWLLPSRPFEGSGRVGPTDHTFHYFFETKFFWSEKLKIYSSCWIILAVLVLAAGYNC